MFSTWGSLEIGRAPKVKHTPSNLLVRVYWWVSLVAPSHQMMNSPSIIQRLFYPEAKMWRFALRTSGNPGIHLFRFATRLQNFCFPEFILVVPCIYYLFCHQVHVSNATCFVEPSILLRSLRLLLTDPRQFCSWLTTRGEKNCFLWLVERIGKMHWAAI